MDAANLSEYAMVGNASIADIYRVLETVPDPEIPVLTILDLGIVRQVLQQDDEWVVRITPTYSGCPAMDTIKANIEAAFLEAGYDTVRVETVLFPAWTTDWMTAAAKEKLKRYGIAPPSASVDKGTLFASPPQVDCPHCHSSHTHMISRFGSTPCKALYQCLDCKEPFDYFKCH